MEGMHQGVLLGAALAALVASAGVGCGSSSSAPLGTHHASSSSGGSGSGGGGNEGLDGGVRMIPGFTGVVSCSQPLDAGAGGAYGDCQLSMPVSGGLSGTLDVPEVAVVCGSSNGSTGVGEIDWATGIGQSTTVGATVFFDDGLPLDTTGTFPAHVEIDESFSDGGVLQWMTPQGGCSIVIAGSECLSAGKSPFDGGTRYSRLLSGTGSCSQPAAPKTGTSAPPITIGNFAFLQTVGP